MYLEYADATEVAEVLTRVMQNLSRLDDEATGRNRSANASKSTIEADAGTNSLIITADTDEMAALEAVIARLDIRRAQVLVEAIIVEMEIVEGRELGLQWLFANDSGLYGSNISTSELSRAETLPSLRRLFLRTQPLKILVSVTSRVPYRRCPVPPLVGAWLIKG